jgi:hypothetical protein
MKATMGAMTMTMEAMVAQVMGMAISKQGTDERGRWETHANQLKLNNNNSAYNNDEHNDNTMYNDNVASSVPIGQTPA